MFFLNKNCPKTFILVITLQTIKNSAQKNPQKN